MITPLYIQFIVNVKYQIDFITQMKKSNQLNIMGLCNF